MKKEKMIKVWTVIPSDFERCTVHFLTSSEAERFVDHYDCSADIVQQELPQRIIDAKEKHIATKGYRL